LKVKLEEEIDINLTNKDYYNRDNNLNLYNLETYIALEILTDKEL